MPTSREGFTLIELLVVIVIIAVLASILSSVLQRVRARADQITCASQQKQIGAAIMMYAADNNQTLPGPVYNGQQAYYNIDKSYGMLLNWIYPYLGYSTPDNTMRRSDIFVCPAFQKRIPVKDGGPRPYLVSGAASTGGVKPIAPFGELHTDPIGAVYRTNMIKNFATTAMLCDLDGQIATSYANMPTVAPASPIHGATRNFLFFDGHVEASSQNLFTFTQ